MHKRVRLVTLITLLLAVGFAAWDIPLWHSTNKTMTANYTLNLYYAGFYIFASYLCLVTSQRLRGGRRDKNTISAFRLWAFALIVYALGLLIWSYYNLVTKVAIPYPSPADFCFLLFLPIMAYGTWKIQGAYQTANKQPLLAGLPLIITSMILVFFVFARPDLSSELPLLTRLINFASSLGDGLLLSMSLVALQGAARNVAKRHFYLLITGLLMLSFADFIFYYMSAHDTYWNGSIADVFYAAFPLIFANGVVRSERYLSKKSA